MRAEAGRLRRDHRMNGRQLSVFDERSFSTLEREAPWESEAVAGFTDGSRDWGAIRTAGSARCECRERVLDHLAHAAVVGRVLCEPVGNRAQSLGDEMRRDVLGSTSSSMRVSRNSRKAQSHRSPCGGHRETLPSCWWRHPVSEPGLAHVWPEAKHEIDVAQWDVSSMSDCECE